MNTIWTALLQATFILLLIFSNMTFDMTYAKKIVEDYQDKILELVKVLLFYPFFDSHTYLAYRSNGFNIIHCKGTLQINPRNGYFCATVDPRFATNTSLVLLLEGFTSRYWLGKPTASVFPGEYF